MGSEPKEIALTRIQDAMIWMSWPKKSFAVSSEITEDVVRELALLLGLVDVKLCAIDETWSGLKLVIRGKNSERRLYRRGCPIVRGK